MCVFFFFFSSRRRHTRSDRDWSSDVCSSDLPYSERPGAAAGRLGERVPPGIIRERARELRERGEAKARAHRVRRQGQRADAVVCGRREGKVEVLTEDYLSVYLPTHDWNGRPRFEVTVS